MNIEQPPKLGGGGNALYFKRNLKPYLLCFLSIICIHWGIASYQPFIDTALILLCGGIIAIIIDNEGDLKVSLYKSRFIIIAVALGTVSYQAVNVSLKWIGKIADTYNNQMIAFGEMPNRIFIAFKAGFEKLFVYSTDFMPLFITILFVVFVVMFLALLISLKIKTNSKFAIIALFFSAIIASQTHIILAKTFTTNLYVEYYGLPFLRVIIVALVFKCMAQFIRTQILLQSLAFALSCVFIWICVVQDLEAQKVHKLAMDRDFRLINRIIDRIEQSEGFSYNKQYYGLMFGQVKNQTTKDFIFNSFQPWSLKNVFTYTMPKDIFAKYGIYYDFLMQEYYTKEQIAIIQSLISRLHKAGILDKLQPFPHKNSVVVFEDIIVFVASKGDLDEIKQMAKDLP